MKVHTFSLMVLVVGMCGNYAHGMGGLFGGSGDVSDDESIRQGFDALSQPTDFQTMHSMLGALKAKLGAKESRQKVRERTHDEQERQLHQQQDQLKKRKKTFAGNMRAYEVGCEGLRQQRDGLASKMECKEAEQEKSLTTKKERYSQELAAIGQHEKRQFERRERDLKGQQQSLDEESPLLTQKLGAVQALLREYRAMKSSPQMVSYAGPSRGKAQLQERTFVPDAVDQEPNLVPAGAWVQGDDSLPA